MKKYAIVTAILCLLLSPTLYAYNKLIVFGDSLSDLGYQDLLGPHNNKDAVWTNPGGKTWPFYLSQALQLPIITVNNQAKNPSSAFTSGLASGGDYAAGGATTIGQGIGNDHYAPPSLAQQIQMYLKHHSHDDKRHSLFIVWAGSNDILLALWHQQLPLKAATEAAINVAHDVALLQRQGAKHIVVINLPNIGGTPFAQLQKQQHPLLPIMLNSASWQYNQMLKAKLSAMPTVKLFDIDALFNTVKQHKHITIGSRSFIFTNVSDPRCDDHGDIDSIQAISCIAKPLADNSHYFFDDGLHPTDYTHQAIAAKLAQFINAN